MTRYFTSTVVPTVTIFLALTTLTFCGQKGKNIFGIYGGKTPITDFKMILHPDNTYKFSWVATIASGSDTGSFKIENDTIYFQSVVAGKVDSSNRDFNQITPVSGKVLIKQDTIYFDYFNRDDEYKNTNYWTKQKEDWIQPKVIKHPQQ